MWISTGFSLRHSSSCIRPPASRFGFTTLSTGVDKRRQRTCFTQRGCGFGVRGIQAQRRLEVHDCLGSVAPPRFEQPRVELRLGIVWPELKRTSERLDCGVEAPGHGLGIPERGKRLCIGRPRPRDTVKVLERLTRTIVRKQGRAEVVGGVEIVGM